MTDVKNMLDTTANNAVSSVAQNSPAFIQGVDCYIDGSTTGYIQMFDVADKADVTLGTTTPTMVIPIIGNDKKIFKGGVRFNNGCQYALTTTPTGSASISPQAVLNIMSTPSNFEQGEEAAYTDSIAFDAGTYAQAATDTSLTFAHTTSGTNRVLFVFGSDANAAASTVTGVTYGGVAMTKITGIRALTSSGRQITGWRLINPASGANNVVVSSSSSQNLRFNAVSYTGANQTTQPDAYATQENDTSPNVSVTSTVDYCWMLAFGKDESGARTYSSTSGDTMLLATDAGGHYLAHTAAAISPAGANDMSFSYTGVSTPSGLIGVTITPQFEQGEEAAYTDSIAFDAVSGTVTGISASHTLSHTCTGSNRLLVVMLNVSNSVSVTSVTYNSVSMTQKSVFAHPHQASNLYAYTLIAPSTGANNIVVTLSGSAAIAFGGLSYTGCHQTNQIDAIGNAGQLNSTSFNIPITTTIDNAWIVGMSADNGGNATAGSGTVVRGGIGAGFGEKLIDSNGAKTAGSNSLNMSHVSPTVDWGGLIVSIYPLEA